MHVGTDAIRQRRLPPETPGVSADRQLPPAAAAGHPRTRRGATSRTARRSAVGHRADDRLHRRLELDAARQRRQAARPGPPAAAAERGTAPGGPGTGHVPVPVPGLRVPPGRPAPHPVLVQRRPDQTGQPDQLVQIPPHAGPRPRVPDRRRPRRHVHLLPPGRHRHPASPALPASRRARSGTATTPTSPRRRSSRPGTASGWTWTTPSAPASPTPAPSRNGRPTFRTASPKSTDAGHGLRARRLGQPDPPVLRRAPRAACTASSSPSPADSGCTRALKWTFGTQPDPAGAATGRHRRCSARVVSTGLRTRAAPFRGAAVRSVP